MCVQYMSVQYNVQYMSFLFFLSILGTMVYQLLDMMFLQFSLLLNFKPMKFSDVWGPFVAMTKEETEYLMHQ